MKYTIYCLAILTIYFFSSCKNNKKEKQSIDGIWKSIGYGKVLTIEKNNYAFYDITKISCLPENQGNISDFGNQIQLHKDTLTLFKGVSTYLYTRINMLPDLCNQKLSESKSKDPIYNFEVMSSTIQEHFIYFKRNKIDWDSLYNSQKSKITKETTDLELYLVLDEMITKLKDNHGDIQPTDEIYELAEKLNPEVEESVQIKEYGDFEVAQRVADEFLDEDMTKDSWLIHWGKVKNNIGYIQVKAMWLFGDLSLSDSLIKQNGFVDTYVEAFNKLNENNYIKAEVKGVRLIMDKVMKDLSNTDFLILDVRFNGGGQDAVGLEILKRFNSKKVKVATKRAKYKNSYTKKTPLFVEHAKQPYKKPIYLLTSQQSASATDFMTLASLELKNIKRIGSHTNGALSDALEKKLPNGWYFSISNEEYFDNNNVCYESIGIPVNYELNYPSDRQTFFGTVINDLEKDKTAVLNAIEKLRTE